MSTPTLAARTGQRGIDPRGPRFGAGITAVLLLAVIALALSTPLSDSPSASFAERATQPATILLALIALLFAWGAFAGIGRHPSGALYRALVQPRLSPPAELEDPTPPTFAQGVGFVITLAGLALHLAGVPLALVLSAGAAFVAAFLNSVFGYCLGCQIYLLGARAGVFGRKA